MHQITSARAEVNLRCVRNERCWTYYWPGSTDLAGPSSGGEGTSVACAGACSVERGVGRPSSRVGEETAGSALHQCQGYPPELSPFLHRRESSDGRRPLPRYKRQRKQRSFFWSTTHDKECNYAASRTRSSQVSTFQASSRSSSARSFHRRRLFRTAQPGRGIYNYSAK